MIFIWLSIFLPLWIEHSEVKKPYPNACHSERSISKTMNPLQILLSFWRLWGRKNFKRNGHFSGDSSHTLGMTFGLLPAKNVVILNGMQWSEESPKKWVYCEISHIRSRWQICHSECSVSGMKNLKQIAEDSSYSFGMTSGQKGEGFLAIARNNNGLPPSLGTTVC